MQKEFRFNLQFWGAYFLYEWLGHAIMDDEYWRQLKIASATVPITFAASMFTVHFLLKRYFLKGNRQAFWWGFLACLTVFAILKRVVNFYYIYPLLSWPTNTQSVIFFPKILLEAFNISLIVGVYAMFYFLRAWYEEQQRATALQKDKAEVELQLLKSQVHPHFIFNTLNNIYSLAQHGSPKTADLIYRLSSFLSYSLYDSRQHSIPVSEELRYLHHYLELEKIRYGEQLDVSVNVYQPLDGFCISPMLFLPLVENCFKHGLVNADGECWVRLDLSVNNGWLTLKIENSLPPELPEQPAQNGGGIGLKNVKARLEILYPNAHELRCLREEQSFLTILKIKGESHEH